MAQKTLGQKMARTGLGKSQQAKPSPEGIVLEEIIVNAPLSKQPAYPTVNAAIDRGLADVAAGRVHTRRSYAEYANIEIED